MDARWRIVATRVVVLSSLWSCRDGAGGGEPTPSADPAEVQRRHGLDPGMPLGSRVKDVPGRVLEMFREGGLPEPRAHALTVAERLKLEAALQVLTPLHRRVLAERLRSISFLDGMPNTALTSPANPDEAYRLFDITINAAILPQDASEWLTQKERTCFKAAGSPLSVTIDAGTKLDALVYVLLHEATHVVDFCEGITPGAPEADRPPRAGDRPRHPFTDEAWSEFRLPAARFRDPRRARVNFYAEGGQIPIEEASTVYASLRTTPFVSLYGSLHWLDDLADYVAVYQLTEVLKQPYRIVVRKEGAEVFVYEPMNSELVRSRIGLMKRFY